MVQPAVPDDFDDDVPEGLVDHEAIAAIMEKAKDVLRPLGLTLQLEGVSLAIQGKHVMAVMPCVVRPSAKKKLDEDRESQEALNKMLAEQHDAKLAKESEKIRSMTTDPDRLMDFLFGEGTEEGGCDHENMHPDGFCLDCGYGMDED